MASFDSHCFCARCREKGKGSDPCVSNNDCQACNSLTEEQRVQLSTPSYRLKKEKRELKKASDTPTKDSNSSTLIDPSCVTVVGAVDGQGMVQSPGSSSSAKKKKSSSSDKKPPTKHSKSSEKPAKSPTTLRSSADARIDELDQKWSDRFNRLEALLLAKTMDKEPTFSTVKVAPTSSAPPGITNKPVRSQAKWYGFVSDQQKGDATSEKTVSSWSTDASKINNTYSRIAKAAGISSTPPASRQISQDNLRRWEKSAREASTICNQAAGFNRCLYRVQENMKGQVKTLKTEMAKGKSSTKAPAHSTSCNF